MRELVSKILVHETAKPRGSKAKVALYERGLAIPLISVWELATADRYAAANDGATPPLFRIEHVMLVPESLSRLVLRFAFKSLLFSVSTPGMNYASNPYLSLSACRVLYVSSFLFFVYPSLRFSLLYNLRSLPHLII